MLYTRYFAGNAEITVFCILFFKISGFSSKDLDIWNQLVNTRPLIYNKWMFYENFFHENTVISEFFSLNNSFEHLRCVYSESADQHSSIDIHSWVNKLRTHFAQYSLNDLEILEILISSHHLIRYISFCLEMEL